MWGADSNTFILSNSAPIGKYLEVYQNYLMVGGISAYSSRIQWSELLDSETWPDTNWVDIDKDTGGYITGLETFYNELLVFKSNGFHKIAYTGDANLPFIVVKITDKIGTISNWSIVQVEGKVYFASNDGFYVFDGSQPIKISSKIQSLFDEINKSKLDRIYGIHYKELNQIWWGVTTGSNIYNNKIYAYDYINNVWWKYGPAYAFPYNSFAEIIDNNVLKIYSGASNGFVFEQNVGSNFSGDAIVAYWKSKLLDFDAPSKAKRLSEIYANAKQATYGDITIETFVDFASSGNARTIDVSESGKTNVVRILDMTEEGRHFQFNVTQSGATQGYDFTLNELIVNFQFEGRK